MSCYYDRDSQRNEGLFKYTVTTKLYTETNYYQNFPHSFCIWRKIEEESQSGNGLNGELNPHLGLLGDLESAYWEWIFSGAGYLTLCNLRGTVS